MAAAEGVTADELEKSLASSRAVLYAARARRVPPALDDKVLTAWNGLMIGALAEGFRVLGERRYLEAASRAADFARASLTTREGRLLRTWRAPLSPAPFDAWSSLLFIGLTWILPAQLRRRYAMYMVLAIAMPLCTKAGIVSLSRFVSVLFPGFMALGLLVQRRKWLYWLCLAVFTIALMKFSMRFATGRWVG